MASITEAVREAQQCVLCLALEPESELRQAMTMQVNDRLNEYAQHLNEVNQYV